MTCTIARWKLALLLMLAGIATANSPTDTRQLATGFSHVAIHRADLVVAVIFYAWALVEIIRYMTAAVRRLMRR